MKLIMKPWMFGQQETTNGMESMKYVPQMTASVGMPFKQTSDEESGDADFENRFMPLNPQGSPMSHLPSVQVSPNRVCSDFDLETVYLYPLFGTSLRSDGDMSLILPILSCVYRWLRVLCGTSWVTAPLGVRPRRCPSQTGQQNYNS